MTKKVAIIDDDDQLRFTISQILAFDNIETVEASSAEEGLALIQAEYPQLIFLDLHMPDVEGLDLLNEIRKKWPEIPVIMVTAEPTIEYSVQALKCGAYEFLPKPFDPNKLRLLAKNALATQTMQAEIESLRTQVQKGSVDMVGSSAKMKRVLSLIGLAKDEDVAVSIQGESGTGKELIARAIHSEGKRSDGPFVAVNCAAIPETMIESELFGHEKGAFTGADGQKIGKFEQANQGTIFLDEIGDMPLQTQVKILRALQEKEIQRVGGTETISVDVRVISATHQDLKTAIEDKRFREDLFYRLTVFPVQVPPLRDRKEDIPALCAHFLKKYGENKDEKISFSSEVIDRFMAYNWPGNIRELENLVHRALVLAQGNTIELSDIPQEVVQSQHQEQSLKLLDDDTIRPLSEIEKEVIAHALAVTKGNISKAAEGLAVDRTTLHRKIKQYNLDTKNKSG